jgi:A/G-specific adenine glycosylase
VKGARAERPSRRGAIFYARRADGCVLVRTRPPKGLLGGMTEFPGAAWSATYDLSRALDDAPLVADWRRKIGVVEHVFTHFALALTVYRTDVPAQTAAPEGCRWVPEQTLHGEALPSVMRKVAEHAG